MSLSVSAALPELPAARGRTDSGSLRLVFAGLILTLAFLPLLALHGRLLWSRENYQFAPLLLPLALALALRRCPDLKQLAPGSRLFAYALAGLAWALLALAILLPSPGLSPVAALVLLLSGAVSLGGRSLVRALLPSWLLLWLAVPLPGQLDNQLVTSMQRLVSSSASGVLEVMGVLHARSGDVLEVAGRQLLVEEACSGIHSLLPVLACTLFWLGWQRRPVAHSILLLLAVFPWVLLGNVGRIVVVATLDGWSGINLSAGWGHEALGYVLFAVMLGLMWSTDHWLLFLTPLTARPVDRLHNPNIPYGEENDEDVAKPLVAPAAPPPKPAPILAGPPAWRTMVLTSWPVLAGFGLLAVSQAALIKQSLSPVTLPVALPAATVQALEGLGETAMPERVGPWKRQGFDTKERPADYWLGQFSRSWRYRAEGRSAMLAIFYPFVGWKEVPGCYDNQGWKVQGREVHDGEESAAAGAYVSARLHRPEEDSHAYLLFQMRAYTGQVVAPPDFSIWKRLGNLFEKVRTGQFLSNGDAAATTLAPSYQIQLLVESPTALTPTQEQDARDLFQDLLRACPGPVR